MKVSSKEQKRRRIRRNREFLFIGLVLLLLVVFLMICTSRTNSRAEEYESRDAVLQEDIQRENQRAEELEQKSIFMKTREFIEQIAREKLGLVKPDEHVVKPDD